MTRGYLRAINLARAVGVHPNTVRLYEAWGSLLPPSGYRQFTEIHLAQMRLARMALHGGWPGRAIRRSALALVRQMAANDVQGALKRAQRHLALVQGERAQAEAAVAFLELWAQGLTPATADRPLSIRQAAELLGITPDALRN